MPADIVCRWKDALLALLFLAFGAIASPAAAHPHAWIDLRSTVILDEEGRVVGIEQEWLFDEFYTAFALEDLGADDNALNERLRELASANLTNLQPYDYFTEVRAGEGKVRLGTVAEFETELRAGRLWLRFVLPLESPVDPRTNELSFAIFDPTYYIEMLHLEDDVIAFRGGASTECTGRIIPPDPPAEAVMLAAALDQNMEADETLGALFAETVVIACR